MLASLTLATVRNTRALSSPSSLFTGRPALETLTFSVGYVKKADTTKLGAETQEAGHHLGGDADSMRKARSLCLTLPPPVVLSLSIALSLSPTSTLNRNKTKPNQPNQPNQPNPTQHMLSDNQQQASSQVQPTQPTFRESWRYLIWGL